MQSATSRTLQSTVRYPRAKITVNGDPIRFEKFEVTQNAYQQADSFQVQLPLFDPGETKHDWRWWAGNANIEIEVAIFVGFASGPQADPNSWAQLIIGPVDAIAMAPLAYGPHSTLATRARTEVGRGGMMPHETGPAHPFGAMLTIEGRDYSGQLIDSEVSSEDVGGALTSQQVVSQLAQKVPGITVKMNGTTASIGDLKNDLQGRMFLARSAWDVIDAIADHEGMRARMVGKTLVIDAPPTMDGNAFQIWYTPSQAEMAQSEFQPAKSNAMTLRMARQLAVGRGIDHFVQSYDSSTGRRPSRAVAHTRSSRSNGTPVTKTRNNPGMSREQTRQHVKSRADQDSKFERFLEFQIPADLALTVDVPVQLSGTGTDFDLSYEVDQLTHQYSITEGYRMECRAKNRSSDVSVTVEDVGGDQDSPPAPTLQNPLPP